MAPVVVPAPLDRFNPDDWPGDGWDRFTLWTDARHVWLRAHRDDVDFVDYLRLLYTERQRVAAAFRRAADVKHRDLRDHSN